MKSFFGKEENEEGLILVDDMWLDRDDLDWEEEGGEREGTELKVRGGSGRKKRFPSQRSEVFSITKYQETLTEINE